MAAFFLPDAHAFGIIAIGAKGGCAGCADPFAAALMTLFLFFEPLFECLHELFKSAQRFNFGLFLGAQVLFRQLLQPVRRNIHGV